MRIKILLGLFLVMLFATSNPANAQYYRRHHGYNRGYYHRGPRAVVVVNPGGPRYHRGYYGRGYRRGNYGGPGYRRGYYGRGYHRGYYGHRRGYNRRY